MNAVVVATMTDVAAAAAAAVAAAVTATMTAAVAAAATVTAIVTAAAGTTRKRSNPIRRWFAIDQNFQSSVQLKTNVDEKFQLRIGK